ncbi:ATP-binding protein [Streptomyces capparidis]
MAGRPGGLDETGEPGAGHLRRRLERGDLKAVSDARRMLREALHLWGAADVADTAELLASELITNALVHTGRDALLVAELTGRADRAPRRLRVEVHDGDPHRPLPRRSGPGALSGRGLLLVHDLSDSWGVRPCGTGKAVWFELRTTGAGEGAATGAGGG